jgi:hypothetical protein
MEMNFSPRLLYSQERTPVPTEQEADWTPEPIWTFCRTEKSLAPIKIRTPGLPSHNSVAVPTTLLRLHVVLLTLYISTYSYLFIRLPRYRIFTFGEHFDKVLSYIVLIIIVVFALVVVLVVAIISCCSRISFREGTTPPHVTGLPKWWVACNILNRQWWTADKEWHSSLGRGWRAKNVLFVKKATLHKMLYRNTDLDIFYVAIWVR